MNEKSSSQKGFTLIEVLVALVILSVGLVGLIPTLLHSVRGNSFGGMTTLAATLSQDKLEELRREPFATLAAGTGTPQVGNATFDRAWTVTDVCGGCGDVLGVEVTTVWVDNRGLAHTARAYTVRANTN